MLYTFKNGYLIATAQPLLLEYMIHFVNTINQLFIQQNDVISTTQLPP